MATRQREREWDIVVLALLAAGSLAIALLAFQGTVLMAAAQDPGVALEGLLWALMPPGIAVVLALCVRRWQALWFFLPMMGLDVLVFLTLYRA